MRAKDRLKGVWTDGVRNKLVDDWKFPQREAAWLGWRVLIDRKECVDWDGAAEVSLELCANLEIGDARVAILRAGRAIECRFRCVRWGFARELALK